MRHVLKCHGTHWDRFYIVLRMTVEAMCQQQHGGSRVFRPRQAGRSPCPSQGVEALVTDHYDRAAPLGCAGHEIERFASPKDPPGIVMPSGMICQPLEYQ